MNIVYTRDKTINNDGNNSRLNKQNTNDETQYSKSSSLLEPVRRPDSHDFTTMNGNEAVNQSMMQQRNPILWESTPSKKTKKFAVNHGTATKDERKKG